jgi:putative ABC transport system permease protein
MSRFLGSWAASLRIARREAKRSRGRSLLVIAMIVLPVLGLSIGAVTYDSFRLTPQEDVGRKLGDFEAQLRWISPGPVQQDATGADYTASRDGEGQPPDRAKLQSLLPAGSRLVPWEPGLVTVHTRTGIAELESVASTPADPAMAGLIDLKSGRQPADPGEIALNAAAADRIGAKLGGTVTLVDGTTGKERDVTVAGIVEVTASLNPTVVLVSQDPTAPGFWLVDSPGPVGLAPVLALNKVGVVVVSREVYLHPPSNGELGFNSNGDSRDAEVFSYGAMFAGLGALEIALLAGPAFAIGARHRRRELALVAANGGTPAHLRRIVLADGIVLGAIAALIGLVLGIVVAFACRGLIEEHVMLRRAGGWRVFPAGLAAIAGIAILTGLLAALVPAFSAARQNVVESLAGRSGAVRSRKRWIAVGIGLIGAGAALVAYGVVSVSSGAVSGGLVLGELGLVLVTPALVGLVARVGRLLPVAPRIALRDTSRNRAAAAPAISAVMAAVAATVMIGVSTGSDSTLRQQQYTTIMPEGYAAVGVVMATTAGQQLASSAELEKTVRGALPVDHVVDAYAATCAKRDAKQYCLLDLDEAPAKQCPFHFDQQLSKADIHRANDDPRCTRTNFITASLTQQIVDDGTALATASGATGDDLERAKRTLRDGGVVLTEADYVDNGMATLHGSRYTDGKSEPENLGTIQVPAYVLTTAKAKALTVVSPAAVERVGLIRERFAMIAATTRAPTQDERDAFAAGVRNLGTQYIADVQAAPGGDDLSAGLLLAGLAGIVALVAAAIATGLAAVDGRNDLVTLAAVGASPGLRRRLSLSQSGVIAGLGSLLGAVAGIAGGLATVAAINQSNRQQWPSIGVLPYVVPWQQLIIGVLIVPLVAMLGAGLLTRSRLPIERRL